MMAAGVQQMERGIQRGLVRRHRSRTQKQRKARRSTTLDCRRISRRKISEKRENFRANFAVYRTL
jgi:hypothetical protein